MGELPAGTVTLLLTDVEGSTRAWEADEAAMRDAMAIHERILATVIESHGGERPREQGEGDSVVAAFARPSDAIAAALEAQVALGETSLRVRMGVHTGEVDVVDGTTYAGPTVIRAARLRGLAHGGQVLVSHATADVVADRLPPGAALVDLGPHRLRGLQRTERVFQLTHADLVAEFPPLRDAETVSNLPTELSTFIGREAELAEVTAQLAGTRLLTLTGAGGCGKTRLALRVAGAAEAFADGRWWADLATISESELIPQALMSAIGLPDVAGRPLIDRIADFLAGGRTLVVLDNVEHLIGACSTFAHYLLERCASLTILATSREPLGVPGEVAYRVPSLSEQDALQLFARRARQARPNFAVTEDNTDVVSRICARLDGMPLAIELAAARVRAVPPARVLAGLDDRFRLLTGGARTAVARQQTLAASVEWSYDLLDAQEQALLRRLSVFSGSFDLEAAEAVCEGEGIDAYEMLDLLARLVDKSLLVFDGRSDRYRLLETVRQFAAERLTAAGETPVFRDRHLAYFLSAAEETSCNHADSGDDFVPRVLDTDNDNFRAALEWSGGADDPDLGLRLAAALTPFWFEVARFAEGRTWLARVLSRGGSPGPRAWGQWALAYLLVFSGERSGGSLAKELLSFARDLGDDRLTARALVALGFDCLHEDAQRARELAAEGRALAESAGDHAAAAEALKLMLSTYMIQDQDAGPVLAEAATVARVRHNTALAILTLVTEGFTAHRRGRLGEASGKLLQSLELARSNGHPGVLAPVLVATAEMELFSGDSESGRLLLEEGLELVRRCGAGVWEIALGSQLAFVLLAEGKAAEVRAAVAEHIERCRQENMAWGLIVSLLPLGVAELLEGRFEEAVAALEDVAARAVAFGNPWMESMCFYFGGIALHLAGELERAETFHHRALALRAKHGFQTSVAESLEGLAAVVSAQGSYAEAARIYGAAARIRDDLGFGHRPGRENLYEMHVTGLRSTMGDEAFEAAWAEGAGLSLNDAVSYATRARGERVRPSMGWASLTPTELAVVRAVREGLTNPEIGERLFIARSTVKTHLAHVFAKVGVGSRAELAAAAAQRGI